MRQISSHITLTVALAIAASGCTGRNQAGQAAQPGDTGFGSVDGSQVTEDAGAGGMGLAQDSGNADASALDSGTPDGAQVDASGADAGGAVDAGNTDAATQDAGMSDAGDMDAQLPDSGMMDAGPLDAGPDAGGQDSGSTDAGDMDAQLPDSGMTDAGPLDADTADSGSSDSGTPASGLPEALGEMAVAVLDGKVHLVGGATTFSNGTISERHWVYDPASDEYSSSEPVAANTAQGACMVEYDGSLYLVGGFRHGASLLRRFDPGPSGASGTWTALPDAPNPRTWGHACAQVNGILYVIGGINPQGKVPMEEVDAYDIEAGVWLTPRELLPSFGYALSATAIGTLVYVVGSSRTVYIYDTVQDWWSDSVSLPREALGAALVELNGTLYAMGGYELDNTNVTSEVNSWTPGDTAWSTLGPLQGPRSSVAAAVVEGMIHVFGGYDKNDEGVSTHEILTIQ